MLWRTQAGLIEPLACAAGSESIEVWRVKIETTASHIEPSEARGSCLGGGGGLTMADFHKDS